MDEDAAEDRFVSDWEKRAEQLHRNGYQSGLNFEESGDLTDPKAYKTSLVASFKVADGLGRIQGRVRFVKYLASRVNRPSDAGTKLEQLGREIERLQTEAKRRSEKWNELGLETDKTKQTGQSEQSDEGDESEAAMSVSEVSEVKRIADALEEIEAEILESNGGP